MANLAQQAVAFAKQQGAALDSSAGSIVSVESILGKLHEARLAGKLSDDEVWQRALEFGAYIGEILRETYNGSWAVDHAVVGPKTFPISWSGEEAFPVGWCGKRILNGEEDNVLVKFQVITKSR
jgi:hypothetical protein